MNRKIVVGGFCHPVLKYINPLHVRRWSHVWLRFERGINVLSGSQSTHKRINSVLMGGRKSRESTSSRGASRRIYDAWQICSGVGNRKREREKERLANNVLDPLLLSPLPFLSPKFYEQRKKKEHFFHESLLSAWELLSDLSILYLEYGDNWRLIRKSNFVYFTIFLLFF